MDHLPAGTDFYGSGLAPHPGVVLLSPDDPRSRVLPLPVFLPPGEGSSWVEYLHSSTRRTLGEVRSRMLESLERGSGRRPG